MNLIRLSLLFVTIFVLSGCCCMFYVPVETPKVFSGHKIKEKNHSPHNPVIKKKDEKEESK